jgi:hypothetical protein
MTMKSTDLGNKISSSKRVETEELNRIKGHFMEKYGVPVDKFSAIVLQEINEEFEKMDAAIQISIDKIDVASQKIKGLVKHISFQNKWAAFWYAIGRGIPYSVTIICLGFLLYSAFIYSKSTSNEKLKKLTKTDQNSPKLTKHVKKKPKLTNNE